MPISKAEQIEQRRAKVLELAAQGLTQQEIADKLGAVVSQQTVSRDLEYLQRESQEYIRQHNKHVALEYRKVLSSYHQLNRIAWGILNDPKTRNDKQLTLAVIHAIQHINADIMNIRAAAEPINLELEHEILEDHRNTLNELQSNGTDTNEAVF